MNPLNILAGLAMAAALIGLSAPGEAQTTGTQGAGAPATAAPTATSAANRNKRPLCPR
jgi:hypothetical protein